MNVGSRKKFSVYLRSTVFGIEDSLVSTVGLLSGIEITGTPRPSILIAGIVYIIVEAFSMAVGSFLSEESAEEYLNHGRAPLAEPIIAGVIMFFSFVVAGLIPLLPYLLLNDATAFWVSIALSLATLFILGVASAELSRSRVLKNSVRMVLLGGLAILIGVLVGKLVKV